MLSNLTTISAFFGLQETFSSLFVSFGMCLLSIHKPKTGLKCKRAYWFLTHSKAFVLSGVYTYCHPFLFYSALSGRLSNIYSFPKSKGRTIAMIHQQWVQNLKLRRSSILVGMLFSIQLSHYPRRYEHLLLASSWGRSEEGC